MQKLYSLVLIFFVVCLSLSSCKKDDSATSSIPKELIGKWREVKRTFTNFENGQQVGSYDLTYDLPDYDEYFNNGTMTFAPHNGNKGIYSYSIKDGVLIIKNSTGQQINGGLILELTATKLVIRINGFDVINSAKTSTVDYEYAKVN